MDIPEIDEQKYERLKQLANEFVGLINSSRQRGVSGINSHIKSAEIVNAVDKDSYEIFLRLVIENESLSEKHKNELKKLL